MSFLKGEVEIIKREAHWDEESQSWIPGKVIETIKESNNLSYEWFNNRRNNLSAFDTAWGVSISGVRSRGRAYQRSSNNTAGSAVGGFTQGEWIDRVPYNIYEPAVTLGYRVWRYRFDPPASDRYIANISLRSGTSLTNVAAGVMLTELCLQTTSELLDIFYRIYVDEDTTYNAIQTNSISKRHAFWQGYNMFNTTASAWFPTSVVWDWFSDNAVAYATDEGYDLGTTSFPQNNALVAQIAEGSRDVSESLSSTASVGSYFGSVSHGRATTQSYYRASTSQLLPVGVSRVQSVFPKLKTSVNPYLDIDNAAVGTGSITVAETTPGSSWAPVDHKFGEMYRIFITTSGDVGTSAYKFYKRTTVPSAGEVWSTSLLTRVPQVPTWTNANYIARIYSAGASSDDDGLRHGVHGTVDSITETPDNSMMKEQMPSFQMYNYPEYISLGRAYGNDFEPSTLDIHGITLYDLNGYVLNLNSTTTPALSVTDVRQIATEDDGTIWVACSDTGLWKVTRAAATDLSDGYSTIQSVALIVPASGTAAGQVLNSTICRGVVAKKTNGTAVAGADLWAIFDKEMCKSVDSGVTWTVYNDDTTAAVKDGLFVIAGVTDASDVGTGIMHFERDHHHATKERFFIAIRDAVATSDGKGAWWSTDLTDNPLGAGVKFTVDTDAFVTNKIIGAKCIYAGKDGDWYFAHNTSYTGIHRFVYNATSAAASSNDNSISTRVGQGVNVYFDDAGLDWIVGYDQSGSNEENVKGRRPQDATNTSSTYKVLAWRLGNSTTTDYDGMLSGLYGYIGKGFWLSLNTNNSDYDNRYYQFNTTEAGGIDSSGVIADPDVWTEYGWAGGTGPWTAGDSTAKLTHAGSEALVDGVEVAFTTDGNLATSFTDTDMYDAYLFNGIIKDNATTMDYTYMTSSLPVVTGNSFVDAAGVATDTVPGTPVGAVTNELIAVTYFANYAFHGYEPGEIGRSIIGGNSEIAYAQAEQVLSGDFTVEFKMNQYYKTTSTSYDDNYTVFGLVDMASAGISTGTFDEGYIFINGNVINNSGYPPNNTTRQIAVGNGAGGGGVKDDFVDHVFQQTNSAADDYFTKDNLDLFRINRVGSAITYDYKRNGEGSWTTLSGGGGEYTNSNDLILNFYMNGPDGQQFYDMNASYTDSRHFVFIGDGSTTGPGNNQNANGVTDTFPDKNFKGVARTMAADLHIEVEETPASGVYVSRTLVAVDLDNGLDPGVQPAVGEVLIGISGKVVFNAADAGLKFKGGWIYNQSLNLRS